MNHMSAIDSPTYKVTVLAYINYKSKQLLFRTLT